MIPRYPIDFSIKDFKRGIFACFQDSSKFFSQEQIDWPVKGRSAIFTWDGRTALRLILRFLGLKPGEAVVVPRWTCSQVHHAIKAEEGNLVFADVRPGFFMPQADDYVKAAADSNARFVIVISAWGYPADVKQLKEKLPQHVKLIQDCALSAGSLICEKQDGFFSDMSFFSFGVEKPFCLGGGGAVTFSKEVFPEFSMEAKKILKRPTRGQMLRLLTAVMIKKILWSSGVIYAAYRNIKTPHYSGSNIAFTDDLLGAPLWVYDRPFDLKEHFETLLFKRKKSLFLIKQALSLAKIKTLEEENGLLWNGWMVPYMLPETECAEDWVKLIKRNGFEAKIPYEDAPSSSGLQFPRIFLGPSLEMMTDSDLSRFIECLKQSGKN